MTTVVDDQTPSTLLFLYFLFAYCYILIRDVLTDSSSSTAPPKPTAMDDICPTPPGTGALNASSYPHIIDDIIDYSGLDDLLVLRNVCRRFRTRIDHIISKNLVVTLSALDGVPHDCAFVETRCELQIEGRLGDDNMEQVCSSPRLWSVFPLATIVETDGPHQIPVLDDATRVHTIRFTAWDDLWNTYSPLEHGPATVIVNTESNASPSGSGHITIAALNPAATKVVVNVSLLGEHDCDEDDESFHYSTRLHVAVPDNTTDLVVILHSHCMRDEDVTEPDLIHYVPHQFVLNLCLASDKLVRTEVVCGRRNRPAHLLPGTVPTVDISVSSDYRFPHPLAVAEDDDEDDDGGPWEDPADALTIGDNAPGYKVVSYDDYSDRVGENVFTRESRVDLHP